MLSDYRAMWRWLNAKHRVCIPSSVIAHILKEVDSEGPLNRQAHHLRRREYFKHGQNYCWYADGYNKLKLYRFPIHRCIDGYSHRTLWLALERSNTNLWIVRRLFVNTVKIVEGCP